MQIPKPTVGRVVEVHLATKEGVLKKRCALVVSPSDSDKVNLKVFLDDTNDRDIVNPSTNEVLGAEADKGTLWLTSADFDATASRTRTWRYPPRSDEMIEVPDPPPVIVPDAPAV